MRAIEYDSQIGIKTYTTQSPGIGGRLRQAPEDFIVQEIGLDGSIAPLEPTTRDYSGEPGKFTAFFLVKRNIDSIQAIRRLSKAMGVSYKRFSYAGIKDRRAVTSQQVSFRGSPHELVGREVPAITILHPHRVRRSIVPGALLGNRFTIIVREISLKRNNVEKRLTQIAQEFEKLGGVLNFYGPQRFGIIRSTTHLIGKQLILGNFEEAIRILLHKRETNSLPEEEPDTGALPPVWDSAQGTYERAIIHYLNKHPRKFKESLQVLPKDLTRLYIHAYQSFIFNKTISERKLQGITLQRPVVGDFTMPVSGEVHAVRPVTSESLSQAEQLVKNGTHKLVVPVIGHDFEQVSLEGQIGEIITAILDNEDITPQAFRMKEFPILSSRGTFRPLLVTPSEFSSTLMETDGELRVRVRFDLPKGSYASVIFREIIKPDLPTQL